MNGVEFPRGDAVTIEQLTTDPHPVLAELRSAEPVSWVSCLDGWLVTRRDLCIEVLRDPDTFTVDDPRFSTAQVIGPSMLSLDGPEHDRHRSPFVPPYRSGTVISEHTTWLGKHAAGLVDELVGAGRADLRSALAAPLAVDVMARSLDLDGIEAEELLQWYRDIVAAVDAATEGRRLPVSGLEAFEQLGRAVMTRLGSSRLLEAVSRTGDLTPDEIVSNVAVLLFGGIVTAESTTAIALRFMLEVPALRNQDSAGVVEEAIRIEPAAAVVDRYATRPARLGTVDVEPGDLVRVSLAGANRDPATFDDPDHFDPRRRGVRQHLSFAVGPHACLGIHLARLESQQALTAVLGGLPRVRAVPSGLDPVTGLVFRAPATVRAEWE